MALYKWVAIQKSLRAPDLIPEMILVGIQNKNPLRRRLLGQDSDKFYSFLEQELVPFMENNIKTSNERILFGWKATAYFTCSAIFQKKRLFNGAISTNGAYAGEKMRCPLSGEYR